MGTDVENESKDRASEKLAHCSNKFAERKVAEWWEFAWSLFAKFGRYSVTSNESANGEEPQRYPEWWLNSLEVGYTTWAVNGPYHGRLDPVLPPNSSELASSSHGKVTMVIVLLAFISSAVGVAGFQIGLRFGQRQRRSDSSSYVFMA